VFRLTRIVGLIGACAVIVAMAAPSRAAADDDAAARLAQTLAAAEARHGKASPDLLPIIDQLARARHREGALDEAAALRRRALDIAIVAYGCDSSGAGAAMAALAAVDIDRRRYLDAEPLLIAARGVLQAGIEANRGAVATTYAGLARIALARGEAKPAESWARRAVAAAGTAGDGAEPRQALGAVLGAEQRFDEAERVLTEALTQDRRQHGADAADTARSLSQLGNLYLRQGRAADALPLIEVAAAIEQKQLGPTHPFIADDLYDLGLAYDALKRRVEARHAFLAAIAVLERGAGRDTPRVAYAEVELSRLYRQEGDGAAADAAFRDARRILNKVEAEEHKREREV
jgi:hypothetical protein